MKVMVIDTPILVCQPSGVKRLAAVETAFLQGRRYFDASTKRPPPTWRLLPCGAGLRATDRAARTAHCGFAQVGAAVARLFARASEGQAAFALAETQSAVVAARDVVVFFETDAQTAFGAGFA